MWVRWALEELVMVQRLQDTNRITIARRCRTSVSHPRSTSSCKTSQTRPCQNTLPCPSPCRHPINHQRLHGCMIKAWGETNSSSTHGFSSFCHMHHQYHNRNGSWTNPAEAVGLDWVSGSHPVCAGFPVSQWLATDVPCEGLDLPGPQENPPGTRSRASRVPVHLSTPCLLRQLLVCLPSQASKHVKFVFHDWLQRIDRRQRHCGRHGQLRGPA